MTALGQLSSTNETVLEKLNQANEKLEVTSQKLDGIDYTEVLDEIRHVETMVRNISHSDVLNEIGALKAMMEKNSASETETLNEKIAKVSAADYTDKLNEMQALIQKLQEDQEEMKKKVDRVSTMPNMLKSVMEQMNGENLVKIEDKMVEINGRQTRYNDKLTKLVNINLWISGVTLALFIFKVMGML